MSLSTSKIWRCLTAASVWAAVVAINGVPSDAVGETLSVALSTLDGTPDFDSSAGAGLDTGDSNGIVRTNDYLTYKVEIGVSAAAAADVTFTLSLPQGVEVADVPPFCIGASSLTPASLAAPVNPITATSWTALGSQTVVCDVGGRIQNSTLTYDILAKVRSEVPNAATIATASLSVVSADVTTPVTTSSTTVTASARPRFDVSNNSITEYANGGYYYSFFTSCSDGSGRQCQRFKIPMLISAAAGGKGSAPLQSPVVFTQDLSVAGLYGSAVLSDPDFVDAGSGALAKYGAVLVACASSSYQQPRVRLGSEVSSVRESGATTCTQPGPGEAATVSISGMDSSAYTVPSVAAVPYNTALPADRGYVYSYSLSFEIPMEAVNDLGAEMTPGVSWRLPWRLDAGGFSPLGLDGTSNDPAAQEAFNDYRSGNLDAASTGNFTLSFLGIAGAVGNTPRTDFQPGNAVFEGPAGSTGREAGDGQILSGGYTLMATELSASSGTTGNDVTFLSCTGWDPTLSQLAAAEYSDGALFQEYPSYGEAVWAHGYYDDGWATPSNYIEPPILTVEYGNGPVSAGMTCDDADSPGGWHDDPADVPGSDSVEMAAGIYGGVTRVRLHTVIPPHSFGSGVGLLTAIGQRVSPGLPVGTIVPTYGAVKMVHETLTMSEALQAAHDWSISDYNAASNSGELGDRLRVGGVLVRVLKQARIAGATGWTTDAPSVTGGQEVEFQLAPSLTAGVSNPIDVPLVVEDCMPEGLIYVSSATAPITVQDTAPVGAELGCPSGQTYIRWEFEGLTVNQSVPPIEYTARVATTTGSGTKTNEVLVSTPLDVGVAAQRSAVAQVQVSQPSGIALEKVSLTPIAEVNLAGESSPDQAEWVWTLANIATASGPSDIDVIDVLPADGLHGSSFHGDIILHSATVTAGGPTVEVLYTSTSSSDIALDAQDASNDETTGSTVWCDFPVVGFVVLGSGTYSDCPGSPSEVTALRVRRPGTFGSGELIELRVTMTPYSNQAGDVYDNVVQARAAGLALLVGPANAVQTITGATVGNLMWNDLDGNGLQDVGEPGLPGLDIMLSGDDSDGNSVVLFRTTDQDGQYSFADLPSGDYTLRFSLPDIVGSDIGIFTYQSQGSDPALDSDAGPSSWEAEVAVSATGEYLDVDAGVLYPTSSVSVVKKINGDDAAISPGVAVELGSNLAVTFDVANTGNLALSSVSVSDDVLDSGDISCPSTVLAVGASMQCTASVAAPSSTLVHHNVAAVSATPAPLPSGVQFGAVIATDHAYAFANPATVAGSVFHDVNNDGVFNSGEEPISGVEVTVTGVDYGSNSVSVTAASDAYGAWSAEVPSGTYSVAEEQPSGYLDGRDSLGNAAGTLGSDVITGLVLVAGQEAEGYTFGELAPSQVAGTVVDDSQVGLPSVEVTLAGSDDLGTVGPIATTTDEDGRWSFVGLRPGSYTITESQPASFGDGSESAGTNGSSSTNNDVFSVTLASGEASTGNEFVEDAGSISGMVWHDANLNGLRDTGELLIAGVTIELQDSGGSVLETLASGIDGAYEFSSLAQGTYAIVESQPDGFLDGEDYLGGAGGDSSVDDVLSGIDVEAGLDTTGYNFSETGTILTGTVWVDEDEDGSIDQSESVRLSGVGVELMDSSGALIASAVTSEDGGYLFGQLLPGAYQVHQIQPEGYGSSTPNVIDVELGVQGATGVDFGEDLGEISGVIWNDDNGDGLFGHGPGASKELGLAGVSVWLKDGHGAFLAATKTDSTGSYTFGELLSGEYYLEVQSPSQPFTAARAGSKESSNTGSDSDSDSDFDWRTGRSSLIEISTPASGVAGLVVDVSSLNAGIVLGGADIAVDKTLAGSSSTRLNADVGWNLQVANKGLTPVEGVTVTDTLPAGLEFVSVSAPGWACAEKAGTVTCICDDELLPGEAAPLISIKTKATKTGELKNSASVVASVNGRGEVVLSNNTSASQVSVAGTQTLSHTGGGGAAGTLGFLLLAFGALLSLASRRSSQSV